MYGPSRNDLHYLPAAVETRYKAYLLALKEKILQEKELRATTEWESQRAEFENFITASQFSNEAAVNTFKEYIDKHVAEIPMTKLSTALNDTQCMFKGEIAPTNYRKKTGETDGNSEQEITGRILCTILSGFGLFFSLIPTLATGSIVFIIPCAILGGIFLNNLVRTVDATRHSSLVQNMLTLADVKQKADEQAQNQKQEIKVSSDYTAMKKTLEKKDNLTTLISLIDTQFGHIDSAKALKLLQLLQTMQMSKTTLVIDNARVGFKQALQSGEGCFEFFFASAEKTVIVQKMDGVASDLKKPLEASEKANLCEICQIQA